jgi:polysaccharide export outer membrane protein
MLLRLQLLSLKAILVSLLIAAGGGCTAFLEPREPFPVTPPEPSPQSQVPRELEMVSLPSYTVAPPDILFIQAIKIVPKSPHTLEPYDTILVRVANAYADQPIADAFFIGPEGSVDLGPSYGRVKVVGLSVDEAKSEIRRYLSQLIDEPIVSVSLAAASGAQQITGEHLVGPDGRVNLSTYGSVYVAGLTLDQVRVAVEKQLSNYLESPQVTVDIFAYNSKWYYVITQGAGNGDNVAAFQYSGNETVLDAIAQVGGLSQVSSTRVYIARPAPNGVGGEQIIPVNYEEITMGGVTATNYQLMPGDRVFIAEDSYTKFNSLVFKYTQPFQRLIGFSTVGITTTNSIKRFGKSSAN